MRRRAIWILPIAVLASGVVGDADQGEEPDLCRIEVEVTGLRNELGTLRCALFASADGFPRSPDRAVARLEVEPSTRGSVCLFEDVEPGTYAVSIHHDEDGDGRMKVEPPGIPVEGRGTSNNPEIRRAPPRFSDAMFEAEGGTKRLEIEAVY